MAAPRSGSSSVAAVQATNDDASASKLSCVKKGYMKDDYVHFFVRRPVKRSPLINRGSFLFIVLLLVGFQRFMFAGYFARWAAIRALMLPFLSNKNLKTQILSLGAGFDTTFFQLKDEGITADVFVELDFLEVTSKKAQIVASAEEMRSHLGPCSVLAPEKGEIISENYKLFPCDLRDAGELDAVFEKAQLDSSLPTLILAECVLIYMDPEASRSLLKWAAAKFQTAAFVVYEQIHAEDAFGQQMIRNLESRGCPLLGIFDTSTLEAKKNRFLEAGWERAAALDMDEIYNHHIDNAERKRIERLELFDEFEEWHIMQAHYCVAYGISDKKKWFENFGFAAPAASSS